MHKGYLRSRGEPWGRHPWWTISDWVLSRNLGYRTEEGRADIIGLNFLPISDVRIFQCPCWCPRPCRVRRCTITSSDFGTYRSTFKMRNHYASAVYAYCVVILAGYYAAILHSILFFSSLFYLYFLSKWRRLIFLPQGGGIIFQIIAC